MNLKEYIPAMVFLAFAILGFGTGFLGVVLSVAWGISLSQVPPHLEL